MAGDLNQEISVLCNTSDVTATGTSASGLQTGSDYRSRDSSYSNFVTFDPGVTEVMCTVKVSLGNMTDLCLFIVHFWKVIINIKYQN